MTNELKQTILSYALKIGFAIRERVNEIPINERAKPSTSVLKPQDKDKAKYVDTVGEEVGFNLLKSLSSQIGYPIGVIVNPQKGDVYQIGNFSFQSPIFCYFDAIDGTIKLAGLGNDVQNKIYRVGNNGSWATGIAFTKPTSKSLVDLVIKDFEITAIVDGNPTRYESYPTNAIVCDGKTYKSNELCLELLPLSTSTQTNLSQGIVLLDMFQAFDRNSAPNGAEELAVEIYKRIANRNEGGAFDIVRMYGNLGEVLKQLLETGNGIEPQGVGSITINENLQNLVLITPIIEGAGGYVVDFKGNTIRNRKLTSGRPNVIIAANPNILKKLEDLVKF